MKMMMKEPASMPGINASMVKMQAMEEMATDLAKDPECKAMCEKMMTDAGKKDMTASPDAVAAAKEEVMKDPEAMKMVAAKSMMMMNMGHADMKMDGGLKPMEGDMPMKK